MDPRHICEMSLNHSTDSALLLEYAFASAGAMPEITANMRQAVQKCRFIEAVNKLCV